MTGYSNGGETGKGDYVFCPSCGKILPNGPREKQCSKCKKTVAKKKVLSLASNKPSKTIDPRVIDERSGLSSWESFFPYLSIRPLQKSIMESVSEEGKKGNHFVIQAANGIGKTISVLASTLPIAFEKNKTIIYTCRTHQQMSRVIEELKMIKQLKPVSGIALRGRKELCLHPLIQKFAVDSANAADICSYLKKEGKCKYFVNMGKKPKQDKMKEITHNQILDSLEILDIGKSLEMCPFEISKRVISNSKVIAASYQYIFNPGIRNTLLQNLEKGLDDVILIIDEAHNLPSTAVDISSSTLTSYAIDHAQSEALKYKTGEIYDLLEAIAAVLIDDTKDLNTDEEVRIEPSDFLKKVEKRSMQQIDDKLIQSLERLGDFVKEMQANQNKAPLSYTSAVAKYLGQLLENKGKQNYAFFQTKTRMKSGDTNSKLISLSLDPRAITKEIFNKSYLTVSLSGTLDPFDAYISLVGVPESKAIILNLPSPYEKENHVTLVIDKLSSKMEDRIPATFLKMIEVISSVVDSTPKNTGVFCASYTIMKSILDTGLERSLSKPLYIAHQGMSSLDNDKLLEDFKNESKKDGAVLISVLGGRSSEGSDYPGAEMQSVVVVGIPYARPSPTINATIEYLESQFPTKGREFGYNIPALTRASQAAGRPIRSLEDYAVIVLLDYRFIRHYYKKHLPNWLKENLHLVQAESSLIENRIEEFYKYHES
ncbi:MAG: helicase C-terminal domain-containing protein [Candidatus Heimdallarchaeaceae archaeon]